MSIQLFFFNDTATTEIYTLSLHDALPIWIGEASTLTHGRTSMVTPYPRPALSDDLRTMTRSEEHTSELQSRQYLVCRLLLEKKKQARCDGAGRCNRAPPREPAGPEADGAV